MALRNKTEVHILAFCPSACNNITVVKTDGLDTTSSACAGADHRMSTLISRPVKKQGVNIAVIT